jgi:hypothetical protein
MSKNRSAAGITNIVQYDANKNITFVSGSTTLLTISSSRDITTTGTITAQTLVIQTVTSSVSFVTGSTKFGSVIGNTHQFTGSILTSGSIGIGTASPTKALEIISNTSQDGIKISGTSNPRLTIIDTTNSVQFDALTTDTEAVLRTDTNHPLLLSTNGSERMRITSGGIVGIGVTPSAWDTGTFPDILQVGNASLVTLGNAYSQLGNNSYYDGTNYRYISNGGAQRMVYDAGGDILWSTAASGTAGNTFTFSERMRITSGGNVGIGTDSPSAKLEIKSGYIRMYDPTSNINGGYAIEWTSNNGGTNLTYANIDAVTTSAGNRTGDLLFRTSNAAAPTERMRITSGGDVLVGNTSFTSPNGADRFIGVYGGQDCSLILQDSVQTWEIYVNDDLNINAGTLNAIQFNRGSGRIYAVPTYNNTFGAGANMYIASDGNIGRATSSLKYKTDVTNYDKGLDIVKQLRPVYYKSKNESEKDRIFAGLIAEEIQDLGLTEFVQYAEDGTPDALAYGNMVALAFKAIQELKTQNDDLQSQINELKAQ